MEFCASIPDGQSGDWKVDTFTIDDEAAGIFNLGMLMSFTPQGQVNPGTYKRLTRSGTTVMSTTPMEIRDHSSLFRAVKKYGGDVLINGLGLGMALMEVLKHDHVTSVTVIEFSEDVIKLVSPHIDDDRVTIIHADAHNWLAPKGKQYSVVWHDIWDAKSSDNNDSMSRLHRKYGRRCEWQDSWGRRWVKQQMR